MQPAASLRTSSQHSCGFTSTSGLLPDILATVQWNNPSTQWRLMKWVKLITRDLLLAKPTVSIMQLSLISCATNKLKSWAVYWGQLDGPPAQHFLWMQCSVGRGQWVHVGCASTGSSAHPVPPSALVPGRKYHHDPTLIRTRSWTTATRLNHARQ